MATTPNPPEPVRCPLCKKIVDPESAAMSGHRVLVVVKDQKFVMGITACASGRPEIVRHIRVEAEEYEALKRALNALEPPTWYRKND